MLESLLLKKNNGIHGSDVLLAGTMDHGWFGEVSADDFITGDELASRTGLTAGISINSGAGWLKFSLDSKTLYVAKRPFRHSLSWLQLNSRGLVFGSTEITINDNLYKVRLLKGLAGPSSAVGAGYDVSATHGSEWNRLMYHIAANINNGMMTSEGITKGDWFQYSDSEIGNDRVDGRTNFCQELGLAGTRIIRGHGPSLAKYFGVSYYSRISDNHSTPNTGWRPCLELIE